MKCEHTVCFLWCLFADSFPPAKVFDFARICGGKLLISPIPVAARSKVARLLRSWVRIPPGAWMFFCCECCVLSRRCLCDELITRPEESYRMCCVVVYDLETSRMRRSWPALGLRATGEVINFVACKMLDILKRTTRARILETCKRMSMNLGWVTCKNYMDADKSLARPGRKQATFPVFYGIWRFITTLTTAHHLSLPMPNQSIPLPITLLTGAACFLPGRAKDLSAPRSRKVIFWQVSASCGICRRIISVSY